VTDKVSVPYRHLWREEAGVSHQVQCHLSEWASKGVGDGQGRDREGCLTGWSHRRRLFHCASHTLCAIYVNVQGTVRP